MKPFWLVSYHLDEVTAGPSIRFQRYAPLFLEKGYRMTIISRQTDSSKPEFEQRENYDVIWVNATDRHFHHTLFIFKCLVKAAFAPQKPLAVLLFSVNSFQIWVLPFLRLRGIRTIFVNTMQFSTVFLKEKTWIHKLYNRSHEWLYRSLLLPLLNAVVCSTEELGSIYAHLGMPSKKVKTIFNGVNTNVFYPVEKQEQAAYRAKLNLPLTGMVFLFVGLRTDRKGLKDLWESWALFHSKHPENHLLIVGDEKQSSNSAAFNEWWEDVKVKIKVEQSGVILREGSKQVHEYFKAADVFVFLSKLEGMPNVLLEALASGLPTITTAFEGFSKAYGEPGKEILVTERDAKSIASYYEQLITDKILFAQLRSNALMRVDAQFKVERSIEAYINLMEAKS